MGKIIFWLVVIFVILFVLRLVNVAKTSARRNDRSPPSPEAGAMTRCVACGVFLPSAEAKTGPQGPLCGDPHCLERAGDKRR